MKKLFCLILLIGGFAVMSANAQRIKVPVRVTGSMHAKYPAARNVEWRDQLFGYQANFDMNGMRCEARFSGKGEWKLTEMYFPNNNMPVTVRNGLRKSKYRNWEVRESYVTYSPGHNTRYHLRVAKSDLRKKELLFSAQGQLLDDNITI